MSGFDGFDDIPKPKRNQSFIVHPASELEGFLIESIVAIIGLILVFALISWIIGLVCCSTIYDKGQEQNEESQNSYVYNIVNKSKLETIQEEYIELSKGESIQVEVIENPNLFSIMDQGNQVIGEVHLD